ncbi:transferase [Geobacter sp. AOG1]|nr:transferase [Geobacter sp. AOG1]
MSGQKLIIIGGGGFAREVIWLARDCGEIWTPYAILDDNLSTHGQSFCDVPVIGAIDSWHEYMDAYFVVAVGSPRTRRKIVKRMAANGTPRFATLVHPSVMKSRYVSLGEGSIVCAGCILTTQVSIGKHAIVNLASTIGHDVSMGDFCTIAPQVAISGNVSLGDGVEVGTCATVIQGNKLGDGCFVGAGAVVSKEVAPNSLVVGTPARHVKSLDAFTLKEL